MSKTAKICGSVCAGLLILLTGCHHPEQRNTPPPDARRPVIKSETELAAERAARIDAGDVVPAEPAPLPEPQASDPASDPSPPAPKPGRNAIRADLLLIDDATLSATEVLYDLRNEIEAARAESSGADLVAALHRLVRIQTQQEIGTLLVYQEATANWSEEQLEHVGKLVGQKLEEQIARDFGGSTAKLDVHLARYGLTVEQYQGRLQRILVVRDFTREMLMPKIQLRRGELLDYFHQHPEIYSSAELRELLIIEAPFDKFMSDGADWAVATTAARAPAKLRALKHIRQAAEALATQPFQDVAREYSRGLHASDGGSWGLIGKPLQAPYDELSGLIFGFSSGQHSEPIENENGWYIVGCGEIQPARHDSFADVQEDIRNELREEKFNQLASDYVIRLAERATISSMESFINAAVATASNPDWPDGVNHTPEAGVR